MVIRALRCRKVLVAAAVAGVGALGIGVAGAIGGATPGPNPAAGDHPSSEATSATLPTQAGAGAQDGTTPDTGTPSVGVAPTSSQLSTALNSTEGTPGNTVLKDLITTALGPARGSIIASDATTFAASQATTPTTPTLPTDATSHRP